MTIVVALVLSCLSAFSVNADDIKFKDGWELYKSWENEIPSDICGVWLTDGDPGSLTFGIRDDKSGEALKELILNSVEEKDSVRFEKQKYLKSELLLITDEVSIYISKNIGVESTYLDEKRNRVEISVLAERVNDRTTQSIVKTIEEKYGDRVHITYEGDMFRQTVLAVGKGDAGNGGSKWGTTRFLIILVCVIIVLLASGYMIIMAKRGQLIEWAEKRGLKTRDDNDDKLEDKTDTKSVEQVPTEDEKTKSEGKSDGSDLSEFEEDE